jgi:hypothetical protein
MIRQASPLTLIRLVAATPAAASHRSHFARFVLHKLLHPLSVDDR